MTWLLIAALFSGPATANLTRGKGPLDFRCDTMRVKSKPNRTLCVKNVVVRRDNLMVCCEEFEGFAQEDWEFERFICRSNVRARRGDETIWSDQAEFILGTGDLILTGDLVVHRGKSILKGTKVVIDTKQDRARVVSPKGRFTSTVDPELASFEFAQTGDLPAVCPVPAKRLP